MYHIDITICNFKCYRGISVFEDILTGHNVFVGENGTGKTTIFQAIEFVLASERKHINWKTLFPVVSSRSTEGFIELLFVNTDPMFEHEVIIRKSFSLKDCKETYSVNGSTLKWNVFLEFLEIFGLRFYRPFIHNAIAATEFAMFSSELKLLNILQYLGGSVFENYSFIEKVFYLLEAQKDKLDHLSMLYSRVEQLTSQSSFHHKLRKLSQEKVSIYYNILMKKKLASTIIKEKLESQYKDIITRDQNKVSRVTSELKKNIWELNNAKHLQECILHDLKKEEENILKKLERLKCNITLVKAELRFVKEHNDHCYSLEKLNQEKSFILEKVKAIDLILNERKGAIIELEARLEMKTEESENLLNHLRNPEKKEDILNKIRKIDDDKHQVEEQFANLIQKHEEYKKSKNKLETMINDVNAVHLSKKTEVKYKIIGLREQLNSYQECLRQSRKNESVLENNVLDISIQMQRSLLKLRKKYGKGIMEGYESVISVVQAWIDSHNNLANGYFGLVIDNLKYTSGLNLAIESAIGSRLFAHLVSNNHIGTKILEDMKNKNLPGEAWFIPLNIRSYTPQIPTLENAIPMLQKLEFSPIYEKAMEFLFGGILLCKDIQTACHTSKLHSCTCVTIQGDRVTNNGVLYGGYIDIKHNSLQIYATLQNLQLEISTKKESLDKEKQTIILMESNIIKATSSIQELKAFVPEFNGSWDLEKLKIELLNVENELCILENNINKNKKIIHKLNLSKSMHEGEITKDYNESEITSKLEEINKEIHALQKTLNKASLDLLNMEQERTGYMEKVIHYSRLENEQFKEQSRIDSLSNKLKDQNMKLSFLNNRAISLRNEMEAAETLLKETCDKISEKVAELDKVEESYPLFSDHIKEVEKISRKIDYLISKLNHLDYCISVVETKYNVGTLPSHEKNKHTSVPALYKKLNEIREEITNMGNERAEQDVIDVRKYYSEKFNRIENFFSLCYVFFSNYVDWLHNYITKKIETVSENFTDIFSRITGGAEGFMFLDDDGTSSNWPGLSDMTGVNFYVNMQNHEATWNLTTLSNGQKICVLLALSFASVKATSGTLCIYDEIDKALSTEQRKMLHELIWSYKGSPQVLSSSHSLEDASDKAKIFGIK